MISYLAVEGIGGKYVSCELELIDFRESHKLNPGEKKTKGVYILLETIFQRVESIQSGDILVVEQDDGNVINIYHKDDVEKNRRIALRKARRMARKINNQ